MKVDSSDLRILKLTLSAFRGIPGRVEMDLSSPLTLVYAPNGTGKTSFMEAAEWILTDGIGRMGRVAERGRQDNLRCKFSPREVRTEVNAVIELNGIRYALVKRPGEWFLDDGETRVGSGEDILGTLAPHAVDAGVDELTARKMRRMWLRGARFLTESDQAILVDTAPEIREERRRTLSDLMGVRELELQADRFLRFADYLDNGLDGEKGISVIAREIAEKRGSLRKGSKGKEAASKSQPAAESRLQEALRAREMEGVRRDISLLERRLSTLKTLREAAESAALAFREESRSYCRWQRDRFAEVMFSIFGRIHANETFDLLREGGEEDPFDWVAMTARHESIPSSEFSMGQRQDLALSIFLAKARGIGGTFFLDEPMIRLDDLNRVALLDMFRVLVVEEGSRVRLVITTASRGLVRHFQEKFINIQERGEVPLLRVIELEGSPRDGVKVVQKPSAVPAG